MLQKIFIFILMFAGTFLIQWFGNFSGRLPAKGMHLGMAYDSVLIRAFVTQFEYLWLLIIVNFIYTLVFQLGFRAFQSNFLTVIILWLAMGPITSLFMQIVILKEKVTWIAILGIVFVITGSILVAAQKEISAFFK